MAVHTIPACLNSVVSRFPNRAAIRNTKSIPTEPKEIDYRELGQMSEMLANGLYQLGIRKGDRVAIISPPRIRFAVALMAVLKVGAWAVPLDPSHTGPELMNLLHHSGARAAFATPDIFERIPEFGNYSIDLDDKADVTFSSLMVDSDRLQVDITVDDTAILAYTSGTTGHAKGVLLSHSNIISDLENGTQVIPVSHKDVFLFIAPWHHILGLVTGLLLPIYSGALTMYTDEFRRIGELMKANKVTIFTGVPKLYHVMYDKIVSQVRKSVMGRILWRMAPRLVGRKIKKSLTGEAIRFFVSGAAPLDADVASGFRRMGIGMMEGYGLTETSPVIAVSDPFGREAGNVGAPIPNVQAKVINVAEDGVGELLVRGPIVMQGYYKDAEATASAIDTQGWFHTGDLASLDAKGRISVKGRVKNVIVLPTGKNVYPEELEWEFARIPYIEEVLVRLRKDPGGETIEVIVYPNEEALEGQAHKTSVHGLIWEAIKHKQELLAPYKRLRSKAQLVLADKPFPKTGTLDIKRYLYKGQGRLADA